MSDMYIIGEHGVPVRCMDIVEWGEWMGGDGRLSKVTELPGGVRVSTVFLGMDHSFGGRGNPVLWETMVFDGIYDGEQDRYITEEDALAGHQRMVAKVSPP